jgi:hypothetical protein
MWIILHFLAIVPAFRQPFPKQRLSRVSPIWQNNPHQIAPSGIPILPRGLPVGTLRPEAPAAAASLSQLSRQN